MGAGQTGGVRLVVKSKLGVGRDFEALGADQQRAYFVDGKLGVRPAAEVQDASGAVVYKVRGKLMGIPKSMTVTDAEGREVAALKAKTFSPIKSQMDLTIADGSEWHLEGDFLEKEYAVTSGGRVVIAISQKLLNVRDTFELDVAAGVDPALAMAVLWAVDCFVEQR